MKSLSWLRAVELAAQAVYAMRHGLSFRRIDANQSGVFAHPDVLPVHRIGAPWCAVFAAELVQELPRGSGRLSAPDSAAIMAIFDGIELPEYLELVNAARLNARRVARANERLILHCASRLLARGFLTRRMVRRYMRPPKPPPVRLPPPRFTLGERIGNMIEIIATPAPVVAYSPAEPGDHTLSDPSDLF